ncbi:YbhB/YbcL family Raf kinase inhibitor-like protein [Candidatus Micrarchaeota archaeon]|nr:YbhB/YbcL family Raf kinase inhibitor-like protein [Candidatus Micrarchaeota archaeon]
MLSSPAFAHNGQIPNKHSCDGGDVIPPFEIQGVPQNTRSLALIMDDPDAVPVVGYLYVHWVVFNIPPSVSQIPEGTQIGTVGASGSNQNRYEGPCPPPGETHRYFFRLYALDTELSLQEGATKQDVETAMQGHILGQTELAGQYTAR